MPDAPLRPCAAQCGNLVRKGRCSDCARIPEQMRGTDTERGYGAPWRRFVLYMKTRLTVLGIPVICGASLPGGPDTKAFSVCHTQGLQTWKDLHLDHEPPLTEAERTRARQGDRGAIDNPSRVGFLCARCHSAKTKTQLTAIVGEDWAGAVKR